MEEVLAFINEHVRAEKGTRVNINSTLRDADLDSFGITVVLLELDEKYAYFSDIPDDVDPFTTVAYDTITIKEMVDKCLLMSTTT